jgi:hypothetical protein
LKLEDFLTSLYSILGLVTKSRVEVAFWMSSPGKIEVTGDPNTIGALLE